jgi:hypothetical protein
MIAIRQIVKPDNNRVTIELPPSFKSEEVEIIIMPVEDNRDMTVPSRKFGEGKEDTFIRDAFYEPLEDFREYV